MVKPSVNMIIARLFHFRKLLNYKFNIPRLVKRKYIFEIVNVFIKTKEYQNLIITRNELHSLLHNCNTMLSK